MSGSNYCDAGVNIDAGMLAVDMIKEVMRSTHGSDVISDMGSFGGMIDISYLKSMTRPVLVASTDGVGTKTKIAVAMEKYDTIGHDLVNHCINDILVQGASPLFFLDYIATSKLEPESIASVISGVAKACKRQRIALLGGETAEMPGVYMPNQLDLAGTIVGVVERDRIIDGSQISEGDIVFGFGSTGLHTNGYSLARHVLKDQSLHEFIPELNTTLGDALLATHRCYLREINSLRFSNVKIKGLVHITGGGLIDNPPRILPEHVSLEIDSGSWDVPPIFPYLQHKGKLDQKEMHRVFNMGLGMLVIVDSGQSLLVEHAFASRECYRIGKIVKRNNGLPVKCCV